MGQERQRSEWIVPDVDDPLPRRAAGGIRHGARFFVALGFHHQDHVERVVTPEERSDELPSCGVGGREDDPTPIRDRIGEVPLAVDRRPRRRAVLRSVGEGFRDTSSVRRERLHDVERLANRALLSFERAHVGANGIAGPFQNCSRRCTNERRAVVDPPRRSAGCTQERDSTPKKAVVRDSSSQGCLAQRHSTDDRTTGR